MTQSSSVSKDSSKSMDEWADVDVKSKSKACFRSIEKGMEK